MSANGRAVLLPEEQRLLWSLREVGEGRHRELLFMCLDELIQFVREPRCPEMQADGVPCPSAGVACDQCRQILLMLEELRCWIREG